MSLFFFSNSRIYDEMIEMVWMITYTHIGLLACFALLLVMMKRSVYSTIGEIMYVCIVDQKNRWVGLIWSFDS